MRNEIKRQTIHFLGIILGIIIVYQDFISSIRILAALVLLMLIFNWYYGKRYARRASLKEAISQSWLISKDKREDLLKSAEKFNKFEEDLFKNFLKKTGLRHGEKDPTVPPLYFFLSSLICLIFLGREITVLAIITLAVGDSLSAIFGKKFGKHKIRWSKKKSYEGSLAFFISVFIAIYTFISLFPSFELFNPLILAFSAAFFGALIETEPTLTDNLSIPLVTGGILYLIALFI